MEEEKQYLKKKMIEFMIKINLSLLENLITFFLRKIIFKKKIFLFLFFFSYLSLFSTRLLSIDRIDILYCGG